MTPSETVPTNLSTETPFAAMIARLEGRLIRTDAPRTMSMETGSRNGNRVPEPLDPVTGRKDGENRSGGN